MRLADSLAVRWIAALGLALAVTVLSVNGCSGSEEQVELVDFGNRIGCQIPAAVDFEVKTYTATGRILKTVVVTPDDYAFLGTISRDDEPNAAVLSASNGLVFGIAGIDKSQAIAVRFESANGRYFYYLEYQAVK